MTLLLLTRSAAALTSRLWFQPGADGSAIVNGTVLDAATGWQLTYARNTGVTDNTATIEGDWVRLTGAPNISRLDGTFDATGVRLLGSAFAFRPVALPVGAANRILEIDGAAGNHSLRLFHGTDGALFVQDSTATRLTSTVTVGPGQTARVWVSSERGTTTSNGRVRLDLWTTNPLDPANTTPDWSGTFTTANTIGTGTSAELLTHIRVGRGATTAGSSSSDDFLWVQAAESWDPVTPPDPPVAGTAYDLTRVEAVQAFDFASAALAAAREAGDVVGTVDAASAAATRDRTAGDIVGTLDAAAAAATRDRPLGDVVGTVDAAASAVAAERSAGDVVGAIDAAAATLFTGRDVGDLVPTADTAGAVLSTGRTAGDVAGTVDAAAATMAADRPLGDVVGTADAVQALITLVAGTSDTVSTADAASRAAAAARANGDLVSTSDAASAVLARSATLADVVGAADSTSATLAREVLVGDVVSTSDAASATVARARSAADVVGTTDVVSAAGAGAVSTGDLAGTSDQAVASLEAQRGPNDVLVVQDTVSASIVRVVTLGDVVATADAAERQAAWSIAVADVATLADTARTGTPVTVPGSRELRRSSVNRRLTLDRGDGTSLATVPGTRRLVRDGDATLTLTARPGRRLLPVEGASE